MKNISDQTGRSFEYAIVDALSKEQGAKLTARAIAGQSRDKSKYLLLDQYRKAQFAKAAATLSSILTNAPFATRDAVIDRLSDDEAIDGDVTDIRITTATSKTINLSIKNNHHALKHQRPSSLMQQLGYSKGTTEDTTYRKGLQAIFCAFYAAAKKLYPSATQFSELKSRNPYFINTHLYGPVCDFVATTLKSAFTKPGTCSTFFTFLVGNTNYIKVVLQNGCLEFTDFSSIPQPMSCKVEHFSSEPNYIFLSFTNDWKLSMRLHTASTRLFSTRTSTIPSLKFDTQAINMPLQTRRIAVR